MSILTVASKSIRLLRHGSLVIDQDQQSISIDGAHLAISPAEFRLMSLLTRHRDTVFSKAVILDVLFPPGHGRDTSTGRCFRHSPTAKVQRGWRR